MSKCLIKGGIVVALVAVAAGVGFWMQNSAENTEAGVNPAEVSEQLDQMPMDGMDPAAAGYESVPESEAPVAPAPEVPAVPMDPALPGEAPVDVQVEQPEASLQVVPAAGEVAFKALPPALQAKAHDVILGQANAPVQIVEYASLTCPHCATFHTQTFPELKTKFIDSGQVRFIYRHLPWDNMALAAAKVASCGTNEQFHGVVSGLMQTQSNWAAAANPIDSIKQLVRLTGLAPEQVDACLQDEALHQRILADKEEALHTLNVKGTPMLFVGGQRLEGAHGLADIEKLIQAELAR